MQLTLLYAASLLLFGSFPATYGNPIPDDVSGSVEPIPDYIQTYILAPPEALAAAKRSLGAVLEGRDDTEDDSEDELFTRASERSASLALHNEARQQKDVEPLRWSDSLEKQARAYAKEMARTGEFRHSPGDSRINQGENLAYMSSNKPIKEAMIKGTNGWLGEASAYTGQKIPEPNFSSYGHYTQAVWNTTTKVGVAAVSNGKGAWYVVARYSPPGNYLGLRPY